MAVNPINTNDLTLDYTKLMRIPIGDRVQAASSGLLTSIINGLSPIQIALAFPDYYRKQLPDVSNFITANIDKKLAASGRGWDQVRGGNDGTAYPEYSGEDTVDPRARRAGEPEPTLIEMKEKLIEQGIDVDGIYNTIDEKGILIGDPRVEAIKNVDADKLASMGFEKFEDENGKTLIREKDVTAEEAKTGLEKKLSGGRSETMKIAAEKYLGRTITDDEYTQLVKATYAESGHKSPQEKAMVTASILNRARNLGKDGIITALHHKNAFQSVTGTAKDGHSPSPMFQKGPNEESAKSIEDAVLDYLPNISHKQKDFTAASENAYGPGTDISYRNKMLANGGSVVGGSVFNTAPPEKIDPTPLDPALAEYKRQIASGEMSQEEMIKVAKELGVDPTQARKDVAVRELYNQASPTSSDSPTYREGTTELTGDPLVQEKQAGIRRQPITPELKEVLQYAGEESGVEVEVFSGGQNDITQGGDRTGTERHDLGHAADIKLKIRGEDGKYRYLSSKNKDDRLIMSKFITTSRKMGAKGIGSGLAYMGESGIHVGTVKRSDLDYSNKEYGAPAGKEAVWLSDQWAEKAFYSGQEQAKEFDMPKYRKDREERLAAAEEKNKQNSVSVTTPPDVVQIVEKSSAELIPESHPFSMTPGKKAKLIADGKANLEQDSISAQTVEQPLAATSVSSTPTPEQAPIVPEVKTDTVQDASSTSEQIPPEVKTDTVQDASSTSEQIPPEVKTDTEQKAVTEPFIPKPKPKPTSIPIKKTEISAPKFALGGEMYGLNEDLSLVDTKSGEVKAQVGENETLIKQGTSMKVVPETKIEADKILSMTENNDRAKAVDQVELPTQPKEPAPQQNQVRQAQPERPLQNLPNGWQNHIHDTIHDPGSQGRAFNRSKFKSENGYHFTRSAPGSVET